MDSQCGTSITSPFLRVEIWGDSYIFRKYVNPSIYIKFNASISTYFPQRIFMRKYDSHIKQLLYPVRDLGICLPSGITLPYLWVPNLIVYKYWLFLVLEGINFSKKKY